MKVEIDQNSGFCAGVIRAIGRAEEFLDNNGKKLYSLGAIVHNEAELRRLSEKGLITLDRDDIFQIPSGAEGETLLIRAHGQPPRVYEEIKKLGFNIIDCTCPVVLNIQKMIHGSWLRFKQEGEGGQIVLFGKIGHAEVLGLVGQTDSEAIVVESPAHLKGLLEKGVIDSGRNIELFSQTTMSPVEYETVSTILSGSMRDGASIKVHNTICSQVANRHSKLMEFAKSHDIIIFVSGKTSSNGKVLCGLCKSVNIRTYHVASISEIQKAWFRPQDNVGVCGATSTPRWLLEETANQIENLQ